MTKNLIPTQVHLNKYCANITNDTFNFFVFFEINETVGVLLWMSELVLQSDFLHQIAPYAAHQIIEVILCVAFCRQPEGDVIEEWWIFTEGLKHTDMTSRQLMASWLEHKNQLCISTYTNRHIL